MAPANPNPNLTPNPNPNPDQVAPDCTRCALVISLDLRVPLPQRMIDFVVRNVVGVFFFLQARFAIASTTIVSRSYTAIVSTAIVGAHMMWKGTHGQRETHMARVMRGHRPAIPVHSHSKCLLLFLQARAARKIARGVGPHAEAIRNDREFYERWLQPKLERHLILKRQRAAAKP